VTDAIDVNDAVVSAFERPSRPRLALPFEKIGPLFALTDILTIAAAGALGGILYQRWIGGGVGNLGVYAGLGLVAGLIYVLAAHRFGLYRMNELLESAPDYGRVGASWGLAILVLAFIMFLFKSGGEVSRGSIICFFALGGIGLQLSRRIAKGRLRAALMAGAIRGRRAMIVGTQNELAQFSRADLLAQFGLEEVERAELPRLDSPESDSGLLESQIQSVLKRIQETSVEEIVLALAWSHTHNVESLLDRLRIFPLSVRLLPDRAVSTILSRQTAQLPHSYMVEVQRPPLTGLERSAKRLLDVMVAATSLTLLMPVLLGAAVAIKIESHGPAIFRQRRHGFNGKPFVIYKLRTMKVQEDGAAVKQATKGDPRVTRVGRILRETSIDELPQLLNVLQGNMSIVGPRPHAMAHDYEYGKMIDNYAFRHHVKPGITGWAQVQGCRGGTPRLELMERRIALDLWYIDNWSLALDLHIMARTFFELIRRRNAY